MSKKCFGSPIINNLTHPITFTLVGEIFSLGSNYVIPLTLNIDQLLNQIKPIEITLTNASSHYDELRSIIGDGISWKGSFLAPRQFSASLREHISLLLADLHQRVINLSDLLLTLIDFGAPASHNALRLRTARAPFNSIGSGLQYLFGVIDAATYSEATQIIAQLQELIKQERSELNLHSSVLNATAIPLDRLEHDQSKVTSAIITLDRHLRVLEVPKARK